MNRVEVVNFFRKHKAPLFRLVKDKKIPATKNGVHDAQILGDAKVFAHFNIGVACGFGLVVVDVDPRNMGLETLSHWQQAFGHLPETVTVRTAQGGWHYYYKGEVANTKFKGIDIISKGKYVVGPTSVVGGVEYAFENHPEDTSIAPLPEWLIGLCARAKKEACTRAESDEADLTDLENVLPYIDPDIEHDDWIKVGMAIHNANSGDEGFVLWLAWSKGQFHGGKADKFSNEASLLKRWKSFDKDGGITPGTVFYLAREGIEKDEALIAAEPKEMGTVTSIPVKGSEVVPTKPSMQPLPIPVNGLLSDLYNEFMTKAYEPIPVYALGSALSVLSALTQMPYVIGGSIRTRSFNLLLGPAGVGKNDYIEIAKSILREVSQRGGNVTLLGEEVRSGQALKSMLSEYSNRMLIIDEWTDVFERAYAYKRDTVAYEITTHLKTLWGDVREMEGSRRRDKSESIKPIIEPRVSILGTGVPSKFLKLMENDSFITDGLMSRVELWMYTEQKPYKNRRNFKTYSQNPELVKSLTALFTDSLTNGLDTQNDCAIVQKPRSKNIEITCGAHDLMDKEFERVNSMHFDEGERSVIGRLLERMKTYAGIYAIGRGSKFVTEFDIESFAAPLFRYQLEQTTSLISKQRGIEHHKEICLILNQIPRNRFISPDDLGRRSKVFRKLCARKPDKIAFLNYLTKLGYIILDENGSAKLLTIPSL